MLSYVNGCSEKIGGPNKTVEIDESKFGKRKYGRGHPVKGQWVFGGVERESGRTFLVPVADRTAETLMAVIDEWIGPGTTVISDCWGAYRNLNAQGYTQLTVNHTLQFVDQQTGAHTNTIESTWRHVKAYLNPCNRKQDYIYQLAHYMFVARCRAENVDQFTKFLHLVATTDWDLFPSTPFIIVRQVRCSSSAGIFHSTPTTGTCARQQQAICVQGYFSATKKKNTDLTWSRMTCCAGRHIW
jgi:transposase-like protein